MSEFEEQYAALTDKIKSVEAKLTASEARNEVADIKRSIDGLLDQLVAENGGASKERLQPQ